MPPDGVEFLYVFLLFGRYSMLYAGLSTDETLRYARTEQENGTWT
jgi:hypothetical protein